MMVGEVFDIDSFLIEVKTKINRLYERNNNKYANEVALYYMFTILKDEGFPKLWDNGKDFHKMFRNSNVFKDNYMDSLMYVLIESSIVVWQMFCEKCESYQ